MQPDFTIQQLIEEEKKRQTEGLELIASENYVSEQVLQAMGSILTNKYAEGYPGRRYYGGCEVVDKVENLAIERIKKIFNCEYANVQPHSGTQANATILSSVLKPGDALLGLHLSMGGHLTHGSPVSSSGILYRAYSYSVDKEHGLIDYNNVLEMARTHKPKIIICGASAYSRDWDYKKFRAIADEVGALLWADIAHTAGLIAKNLLNDPFDFCHFVTTTTHKTLRGPRGGVILMRKDFENPFGIKDNKGNLKKMSSVLDLWLFPGHQGGPLEHIIAGKAVAFHEILSDNFTTYAHNILKNAKALEKTFKEKGYHIVSGGTDNHLLLIDLRNKNITGKQAEILLGKADITVNKNMVPYDDKTPFVTSGIRIGTPAITTRGLGVQAMENIVHYIDEVLTHKDDEKKISTIKAKINQDLVKYPLFTW